MVATAPIDPIATRYCSMTEGPIVRCMAATCVQLYSQYRRTAVRVRWSIRVTAVECVAPSARRRQPAATVAASPCAAYDHAHLRASVQQQHL